MPTFLTSWQYPYDMAIIISLNNKKLRHYLENCTKKYHYVYLGERREDISQLLNEHAFKEIKIDDYDGSFKDRFLQLYIDLVGKLGLKYNSVYWWATNTAAKNQFASKLFQNLFIFYTTVNKLKEYRGTNVVIINPPREICSSLKKYCLTNSVGLEILHNRLYSIFPIIRKFLRRTVSSIFFLYDSWKKIYIANKYLKKKIANKLQRNGSYYVLRSWFYSRSINESNEYRDSFFGILPHYLVKKGKKLMIVVGIIGNYKSIIRKIANNDYFIVPQEFFIKYGDPIKVIIDIYSNKIKIKGKIDLAGFDVSDIVKVEIGREFGGGGILRSYIYHYYMKRLLNMIDIDTFTTTYENYPWEKMCFLTIKKYSPQTNIIGYQHAALSKAHITMCLSKYERNVISIPDRINTTGKVTRDFLETYGNYEKNRAKESCALRFETLSTSMVVPRKLSYRILLILGGILPRARDMVNFVYRALENQEQYKITVRPHPALPLEYFGHKLDFNISLCNKFIISNNISVKKNIEEADIVIYDASTIALEALRMGIPVIHIALNDIVSFDPLFQCTHLKWTVNREEELQKTIEAIYQLNDDEYSSEQVKARKYVEDYVYEITDERLDEFIIK